MAYDYITSELLDDGLIARIMLNRPETRNAQNRGLLVELDHALLAAEADDRVRVVILGGVGQSFSSGHDLGSAVAIAERGDGPGRHPTRDAYGGTKEGAVERQYLQEWHFFYNNTMRWRNLRKITIAQVQGKALAAGLMIAWACDLIVASEDAELGDPVPPRLDLCGVEFFAHPWEFGHRKAKELLLTGDSIGAEEAYRLGIVSKIFKNERLEEDTLTFARRISALPSITSLLVKDSVNMAQDAQGFQTAMQTALMIHEASHAHWFELNARAAAEGRMLNREGWKQRAGIKQADKYTP